MDPKENSLARALEGLARDYDGQAMGQGDPFARGLFLGYAGAFRLLAKMLPTFILPGPEKPRGEKP